MVDIPDATRGTSGHTDSRHAAHRRAHRLFVRFKTDRGFYVYDAATNHILSVSQELWNALDQYLAARDSESPFADRGVPDVPEAVASEIEKGLSRGFLAPCTLDKMQFYSDEADLERNVNRRVPHLTLELTQRCNAHCAYCPYAYDPARNGATPPNMPWKTLVNAVATFVRHSTEVPHRSVSFWGGEPLLAFPLMQKAVQHISATYPGLKPRYQFTTNGTRMNPEVCRFVREHDFSLVVSLDGPDAIHDKHRRDRAGRGTFARVVTNLRYLFALDSGYYHARVRFICVITPGVDPNELATFFSESELYRRQQVRFTVAVPPAAFTEQHGSFSERDRARWRQAVRSAVIHAGDESSCDPFAAAGIRTFQPVASRPRTQVGHLVSPNGCCVPLLKKMHVTAAGDIHLCERMDGDNAVGNVNRGGVDLQSVRDLAQEYCDNAIDACSRCWAFRLCPACYRGALIGGKWSKALRASTCKGARARVLELLEDYTSIVEYRPNAFTKLASATVTRPI